MVIDKKMKLFCNSEVNSGGMTVKYCGDYYESFQNCRYIHYTHVAETVKNQ